MEFRSAKGRQADAPRPAPHLVGFEFTQNERAQVLAAIKSDPELKRTLCQAAGRGVIQLDPALLVASFSYRVNAWKY